MTDKNSHLAPESNPGPLTRFFFVDKTFGLLLTVLLLAGGLIAYQSMVKESNPDIQIPQATIRVVCPGFSADMVEDLVTDVLESEIKSVRGLKKIRSASFENLAILAVEFNVDLDTAYAMQMLRDKVSTAEGQFPSSVQKPVIVQSTVDDKPILAITIYGNINPALMGRAAERLQERLERISGVREVNLAGRREEQVVIRLFQDKLQALHLSSTQVRDAIQRANQDTAWQRFEGKEFNAAFRLRGVFTDLETLRNTPIKRLSSNRVVTLKEVADVQRTLEKETVRTAFSVGGSEFQPCIDVSVIKSSGADTVKTIDALKAELELAQISSDWPQKLQCAYTTDQSISIWDDLNNVLNNGWQAMLAVFVVLLVMLSWREAIIASVCIPITFMGSLLVLWGLGNSMNQLVVIGMVLALGMLVDVFILMMEGVHNGIYVNKESFVTAVTNTVKTYAAPAFAGQMTTILAMAPLMVIAGFQGKFIRVIPTTAIICLLASFVVAMLISLPLSGFLLRRVNKDMPLSRVDRISNAVSQAVLGWIRRTVLGNRVKTVAWLTASFLLFGGSLKLAGYLPSELYPPSDSRDLALTLKLSPNASLEDSQAYADAVGELLRKKDYLENTVKFVGQRSPMAQGTLMANLEVSKAPFLSGFTCRFTHLDQREFISLHYINQLREELNALSRNFAGANFRLVFTQGGGTSDDPLQIVVMGDDMDTLRRISGQIQRALRDTSGAIKVRDNLGPVEIEILAEPQREALDHYGVSERDLGDQINYAMGPRKIGDFYGDDLIDMTLSTDWASRDGKLGGPTTHAESTQLKVIASDGDVIALNALVDYIPQARPALISREGGRRAVTVMCKIEDSTVGEVLKRVTPAIEEMKAQWPGGYAYKIGGEAEDAAETFGSASIMLVVAIFLVFGLLTIQFNSVSQPMIIMMIVPLALVGTFTGFFLMGSSFSFPAMIGIIALIGIVVNNAIVMIDTMNGHRKQGLAIPDAAAQGAADRLRPIVSTTITTLVGLVPLALSSPQWMPLCSAIIFGLIAGTLFAFIVIPSAYTLLSSRKDVE